MTESTRRALRTLYQGIIALVVTLPVLAVSAASLPEDFPFRAQIVASLVTMAGVTAAVAKVLNELEDRGIIPAWLKGEEAVLLQETTKPDGDEPVSQDPTVVIE